MAPTGPVFDADVLARTARVHEEAGFDRVLIGYFTNAPDGFLVASHVAASTERLGLLLAHRPGFVAPTLAARKLATLDQLSKGRAAVHIISGGSDADQARDGDFADHDDRYRRSAEYVRVLRSTWAARQPFDHHGEFYRVEGALVRDHARGPATPSRCTAAAGSDDAIENAGAGHRHVHAVGRAARRHRRVHGAGAGARRTRRQRDPLQRVDASDHRRDRGPGVGQGPPLPGHDPGHAARARRRPPRRTSGRNACSTSRRATRCSTAACGRRSPRPPAPGATRRRSSARPRRWPRRWPTTSTSGPARCSSAATSRWPTPPPTAVS